jgi:hypothetical protein
MINDSLVEKIRKLLALGSNLNDSAEQAELAMKKAKELAIQNDIDLATIQVFENKKSEQPIVKGEDINLGKRESVCQKFIYWILQHHFNVKVITGGGRYFGKHLTLIGTTRDIQIATYVNSFLNQEFMRLWHQYRDENYDAQTKDRNSYFWGLYNGLDSKLEEQVKSTESSSFSSMVAERGAQAAEQVKNCYALTVTSNKERLDKALGEFYPRLRKASRSYYNGHHSASARESGFAAGRNINLRMGIGGGNGSALPA